MKHTRTGVVAGFLALLTIWGCAQQNPGESYAARLARLQEELKTAISARDQLQKELKTLRSELARIQEELDILRTAARERDQLKIELASRTQERDQARTQLQELQQGLKLLLQRTESPRAAEASASAGL
ncbi:MAG: hypothetical protein C4297_05665 [Gemmataceae bacterium]